MIDSENNLLLLELECEYDAVRNAYLGLYLKSTCSTRLSSLPSCRRSSIVGRDLPTWQRDHRVSRLVEASIRLYHA